MEMIDGVIHIEMTTMFFKYARERLERLIGKQDKEPTLINFEHYQ